MRSWIRRSRANASSRPRSAEGDPTFTRVASVSRFTRARIRNNPSIFLRRCSVPTYRITFCFRGRSPGVYVGESYNPFKLVLDLTGAHDHAVCEGQSLNGPPEAHVIA